MKKQIEVDKIELKALLFWAMSGYAYSNGGGRERRFPEIILKYCKLTDWKMGNFGPLSDDSHSGSVKLRKELRKVYKNI